MRYLPHREEDRRVMREAIGISDIDELFASIPENKRLTDLVDLPLHQSEMAVECQLSALASQNISAGNAAFFAGCGAYKHYVPASVDHLIQRSEFLTSYTPYQPEVSQGTLQYLFEFQTQVAKLMGMEVANASMYDGSTATGEAVLMAMRLTRRKRAVVDGNLHPHYRDVIETLARLSSFETTNGNLSPEAAASTSLSALIDEDTACVVVQTPDLFGHLHDLRELSEVVHQKGALLIVVVTEIVALGALMSPGDMGADIVVAEGQSLGVGLNFGGPYLGLFATRQKFIRQMPGRVCGATTDADGRRSFVLTLSTREQHIRRDKATSNICTNSGLCCLAFTIHLSLLGEKGLRQLAEINHQKAQQLANKIETLAGVQLLNKTYFNEFTLRLEGDAREIADRLTEKGIIAGVPAARLYGRNDSQNNLLITAVTETVSSEDMDRLVSGLEEVLS